MLSHPLFEQFVLVLFLKGFFPLLIVFHLCAIYWSLAVFKGVSSLTSSSLTPTFHRRVQLSAHCIWRQGWKESLKKKARSSSRLWYEMRVLCKLLTRTLWTTRMGFYLVTTVTRITPTISTHTTRTQALSLLGTSHTCLLWEFKSTLFQWSWQRNAPPQKKRQLTPVFTYMHKH